MFEITNKNAIVTGGASGIGLQHVKELLNHGASKVAIFDINDKVGEEETTALNNKYGKDKVFFKKVDVCNKKGFEEACHDIVNQFKRLDIFINNAGIYDDSNWELETDINVKAMFRGNVLALKYMGLDEGHNGGVIVNISSIAGLNPYASIPGYVCTKHAVLGASMAFGNLRNYQRTGVKVLTLCPGPTDTPLMKSIGISKTLGQGYTVLGQNLPRLEASQSVEYVARAMIEIIQNAISGTVWVVENKQPPYQIEFKPHEERKI